MLMVVFGAGASYDSDPDNPSATAIRPQLDEWRPPLAKDLFHPRFGRIAERYPAAQALFPRLRRAARRDPPDVEQEVERITQSIDSGYSPVRRQLLAMRSYLHDVILESQNQWRANYVHDVTTYHELLDTIDRWQVRTGDRVAFVTFNYDTLLDLACTAVLRLDFTNIDLYVQHSSVYQLFKLHGSIDWFHLVQGVEVNPLESADQLKFPRDLVTDRTQGQLQPGTAYVPAIAVPTVTKTDFEFPHSHEQHLLAAIPDTTHLLIVGWRAMEQHFLNLWVHPSSPAALRRVQIVNTSQNSAEEVHQNLIRGAGLTCDDVRFSEQGFSGFVPDELETFLAE